MNRNYLNGFLAAAILTGGAMTVTSCKDNVEDLRAELVSENLSLQEKIKVLEKAQEDLKIAQENCMNECKQAWEAALDAYVKKGDFGTLLNEYVAAVAKQKTLDWYLAQIDGALKYVDGEPTYGSLAERFDAIDAVLAQLPDVSKIVEIPGINDVADQLKDLGKTLPDVINAALAADKTATENKAILDALLKGYEYSGDDVSKIEGLLKKAVEDAAEAKTNAQTALDILYDEDGKNRLDELERKVKENKDSIDELNTKLNAITGQLNKLVTGIELQQVSNPVFGKINLPADIKSGMLLAYFGEAQNVKFPAFNSTAYEYDSKTPWLTSEDQTRLGVTSETIDGILGLEDGKLRLGTIYMTVNPVNLDLEGTKFEFVNSKGEVGCVNLSELESCDEELKFGFGRSGEVPNGLYTADATVTVNTIDDLAPVTFTVDDDFKSKAETMLRNHTLSDIASLTKLIFDQFNNKLPAYGVRAAWEYDDVNGEKKTNATYSELALAATTFKPLSYKFLYGKSFQPIGTISPIEDFTLSNEINIQVPEFNFNLENVSFNVDFNDITVTLEGAEIIVNIPTTDVVDLNGNIIGSVSPEPIPVSNLDELEEAITNALTSALSNAGDIIDDAFKTAMADVAKEINAQINAQMKDFQTSINDQFADIMGDIEGQVNGYLGTVNKYIDKVNGLIDRANNILKDPNHYLQVTMLYEAGDGQFHQLSNTATLPSTFVLNGGDGLRLFATSFTGDILVPSYKKYVAVTNAYRTDDKDKTTATDIMKAANGVTNWNKVVAGTTTEYGFKLTKGYTYEIVYSSLDYHGVTSTRKFYISAE